MEQEKRIVINLPNLRWRSFLQIRFFLIFALLLFSSVFAYWYRNVFPYLRISSAHLEATSALVSSDAAGRIVEMTAQEGDVVKRGQTLFVLDRDLLFAKQAQTKQFLESINGEIALEKERIGKIMEAYLAASSEIDLGIGSPDQVKKQLALMSEAQERVELASEKLQTAKIELGLLDLQLKKMALTAPFDGIVLKKSKSPGAVVSFGESVYVLCDPSRIWVEAEVPESEIGAIALGAPARIRLAAYPKKEFTGKIVYIGSATAAKSALLPFSGEKETVLVKISLENPGFSLKPGLSASITLKVR